MSEQKSPRMIYTVLLANGETRSHIYQIPSKLSSAEEFIEMMVFLQLKALDKSRMPLYFPNLYGGSSAVYNPDWVIGIELVSIDADEYEDIIRSGQEKARRKLGFETSKKG